MLIVDDHAGFRSMARLLLESEGFEVVGEAGDGDEALAASVALRPDLVLLDVHLPGDDGFTVAARLAALSGAPKVVLISSRPASDMGAPLLSTTAVGFIPKSELSAATIAAIVG